MSTCLQTSHLQHRETNNENKVPSHADKTNKAYADNKILAFLGNIEQDFSVSTIRKCSRGYLTNAIPQNKRERLRSF